MLAVPLGAALPGRTRCPASSGGRAPGGSAEGVPRGRMGAEGQGGRGPGRPESHGPPRARVRAPEGSSRGKECPALCGPAWTSAGRFLLARSVPSALRVERRGVDAARLEAGRREGSVPDPQAGVRLKSNSELCPKSLSAAARHTEQSLQQKSGKSQRCWRKKLLINRKWLPSGMEDLRVRAASRALGALSWDGNEVPVLLHCQHYSEQRSGLHSDVTSSKFVLPSASTSQYSKCQILE